MSLEHAPFALRPAEEDVHRIGVGAEDINVPKTTEEDAVLGDTVKPKFSLPVGTVKASGPCR